MSHDLPANAEEIVRAWRLLVRSCIVAARMTVPDFEHFSDRVLASAEETVNRSVAELQSPREAEGEVLQLAHTFWRRSCARLS